MKKDIKDEIDPMIMEMSLIDCILMWSSMKAFKTIIRDRARIAKKENDERYNSIYGEIASFELIEKKSKFISYIFSIKNKDEAIEKLNIIKVK